MSIKDHKWSDWDSMRARVNGDKTITIIDGGSSLSFNSKDSLAIAKHFNQDRESLVNRIKALIDKQGLNPRDFVLKVEKIINETED